MTLKKPQDFFHREKKITTFNKPIEKLVETPEMRSFSNAFDSYKDNINKFNALSDTVKEIELELENYINKEELDHAMVACSFLVNESIEELREKIETETQKSVYNLKKNVNDISESINLFITDEAPKLKKAVSTSELRFEGKIKDFKDEVCLDIEETLKETISKNQSYLNKQNKNFENIKNDILSLSEELNLDEIKNKKDSLDKKINYLENLITDFKKEKKKVLSEGLLNEPPSTKNQDPLTPLDQKFVTFEQLSEHYRVFINRIQQQLSTLGGGGAVRIQDMDDIDLSTAKVNNKFLKYNSTSGKWEGANASGGAGTVDIIDDTTPQLGGNLDLNSNNITGTGNINITGTVTATDINSASDIKLKKNIKAIENPISKIMEIEGVSFNWKYNNKPSLGVTADHLQNILPELVKEDDIKSVNYNGLVGLLIECVKNQQQQIDELKDQLNN